MYDEVVSHTMFYVYLHIDNKELLYDTFPLKLLSRKLLIDINDSSNKTCECIKIIIILLFDKLLSILIGTSSIYFLNTLNCDIFP